MVTHMHTDTLTPPTHATAHTRLQFPLHTTGITRSQSTRTRNRTLTQIHRNSCHVFFFPPLSASPLTCHGITNILLNIPFSSAVPRRNLILRCLIHFHFVCRGAASRYNLQNMFRDGQITHRTSKLPGNLLWPYFTPRHAARPQLASDKMHLRFAEI